MITPKREAGGWRRFPGRSHQVWKVEERSNYVLVGPRLRGDDDASRFSPPPKKRRHPREGGDPPKLIVPPDAIALPRHEKGPGPRSRPRLERWRWLLYIRATMGEIVSDLRTSAGSEEGAPPLSVVVPVFNEEEGLRAFYESLTAVLDEVCPGAEIVFVNDGSSDRSYQVLESIQADDDRVLVVDFARNFGHQAALTAGLDLARGDAILTMDADLEHPPEAIPEFLAKWKAGDEIVFGVRKGH